MSIRVVDYLENLETVITDKRYNYEHTYKLPFVSDDVKRGMKISKNSVTKVKLPDCDLHVWVKRILESNPIEVDRKIINEILFSRIYNALGVNAIISYPCFFIDPHIKELVPKSSIVGTVSQDLYSIKELDVDSMVNKWFSYMYQRSLKNMLNNRSKMIEKEFETNLNAELLFNSNLVTNIVDLIMLLLDNHFGNKFVIGEKGNGHESVVSFDFEDNNLNYDYIYNSLDGFENYPITSKIYVTKEKYETLRDRLAYIKNLYLDGKLPYECHLLFKKLLELNVDKLIEDAEKETSYPILKSKQADRVRALIDYNQEFIAK